MDPVASLIGLFWLAAIAYQKSFIEHATPTVEYVNQTVFVDRYIPVAHFSTITKTATITETANALTALHHNFSGTRQQSLPKTEEILRAAEGYDEFVNFSILSFVVVLILLLWVFGLRCCRCKPRWRNAPEKTRDDDNGGAGDVSSTPNSSETKNITGDVLETDNPSQPSDGDVLTAAPNLSETGKIDEGVPQTGASSKASEGTGDRTTPPETPGSSVKDNVSDGLSSIQNLPQKKTGSHPKKPMRRVRTVDNSTQTDGRPSGEHDLDRLQTRIEEHEQVLHDCTRLLSAAQEDTARAKQDLEKVEGKNEKLRKQANHMQLEASRAQKGEQEARDQLKKCQEQAGKLKTENDRLGADIKNKQNQIVMDLKSGVQATKKLDECIQHRANLETQNRQLAAENAELRERISSLSQDQEAFKGDQKLSKELKDCQKLSADLQTQNASLAQHNKELRQNVMTLEDQVRTADQQLGKHHKHGTELEGNYNQSLEENEKLRSLVAKLQRSQKKSTKNLEDCHKHGQDLAKEKNLLLAEKESLQTVVANLRRGMEEESEKLEKCRKRETELDQSIQGLELQSKNFRASKGRAENDLEQCLKHGKELKSMNGKLREEVAELKKKTSDAELKRRKEDLNHEAATRPTNDSAPAAQVSGIRGSDTVTPSVITPSPARQQPFQQLGGLSLPPATAARKVGPATSLNTTLLPQGGLALPIKPAAPQVGSSTTSSASRLEQRAPASSVLGGSASGTTKTSANPFASANMDDVSDSDSGPSEDGRDEEEVREQEEEGQWEDEHQEDEPSQRNAALQSMAHSGNLLAQAALSQANGSYGAGATACSPDSTTNAAARVEDISEDAGHTDGEAQAGGRRQSDIAARIGAAGAEWAEHSVKYSRGNCTPAFMEHMKKRTYERHGASLPPFESQARASQPKELATNPTNHSQGVVSETATAQHDAPFPSRDTSTSQPAPSSDRQATINATTGETSTRQNSSNTNGFVSASLLSSRWALQATATNSDSFTGASRQNSMWARTSEETVSTAPTREGSSSQTPFGGPSTRPSTNDPDGTTQPRQANSSNGGMFVFQGDGGKSPNTNASGSGGSGRGGRGGRSGSGKAGYGGSRRGVVGKRK